MSDAKNARSNYTVFQLNNLNSDFVEFTSVSTAFFLCFIQLISLNSAFLYFYIESTTLSMQSSLLLLNNLSSDFPWLILHFQRHKTLAKIFLYFTWKIGTRIFIEKNPKSHAKICPHKFIYVFTEKCKVGFSFWKLLKTCSVITLFFNWLIYAWIYVQLQYVRHQNTLTATKLYFDWTVCTRIMSNILSWPKAQSTRCNFSMFQFFNINPNFCWENSQVRRKITLAEIFPIFR